MKVPAGSYTVKKLAGVYELFMGRHDSDGDYLRSVCRKQHGSDTGSH